MHGKIVGHAYMGQAAKAGKTLGKTLEGREARGGSKC